MTAPAQSKRCILCCWAFITAVAGRKKAILQREADDRRHSLSLAGGGVFTGGAVCTVADGASAPVFRHFHGSGDGRWLLRHMPGALHGEDKPEVEELVWLCMQHRFCHQGIVVIRMLQQRSAFS